MIIIIIIINYQNLERDILYKIFTSQSGEQKIQKPPAKNQGFANRLQLVLSPDFGELRSFNPHSVV